MSDTPLVSVLMPVYNGAADLSRSIDSVLAQNFRDFELIAINDGSKDESASILNAVKDPRIRVFHQANMGLAATLNRGLELAQGRLIARQDQDDLSHPDRFAKQTAYFNKNPDCILLGTAAEIWEDNTPTMRFHDHPTEHSLLAFDLLFNNPFVHSSVMMRKEVVAAIGGYTTDKSRQPPEDYELWSRMARIGKVANLSDRLLVYREVPESMSRKGPNPFLERLVNLSAENLAFANGLSAPDQSIADLSAMTHSAFHRLSKKPNIREMSNAILKAGRYIDENNPKIEARIKERIRILNYQFVMHNTNAQWARPLLRNIRALSRRISNFRI